MSEIDDQNKGRHGKEFVRVTGSNHTGLKKISLCLYRKEPTAMHLRSADRRRHTVHGPREAGKKLDAKDQLDVNQARKCVHLIEANK